MNDVYFIVDRRILITALCCQVTADGTYSLKIFTIWFVNDVI